jgi:hypothetical protein
MDRTDVLSGREEQIMAKNQSNQSTNPADAPRRIALRTWENRTC